MGTPLGYCYAAGGDSTSERRPGPTTLVGCEALKQETISRTRIPEPLVEAVPENDVRDVIGLLKVDVRHQHAVEVAQFAPDFG